MALGALRAAPVLVALWAAGCAADDPAEPTAGRESATVTGVSDGDTISLSGLGKARLIGVDTPEVYGQAECYGREASAFAKRLLPEGKRVEYRLGVERRDRYGRALAYVWLEDGRMVNQVLAEEGYAQQLTIPPNVDYADRFRAAVRRAREAGRGLWGEAGCATGGGDTRGGAARCSDFATKADAQRWWEANGRPDAIDGDRDGRVCESLP